MSISMKSLAGPRGVLSLGACLLVGAGLFQPRFNSTPDPGLRFVDVDQVMGASKVFKDGLERITAYQKKKKKELSALEEEIKKKRALRQTLNPGTAEFDQVSVDVALLEDKGKILQNMVKAWTDREVVKLQNYVYDLIRKAVREYAKANHLRAVLAIKEYWPKDRRKIPRITLQDNSMRKVLWSDPSLNITREILKMVNQ